MIDLASIRKILVIKPRAIGDVLLSTPVLANLRRFFPAAKISFLVEKGGAAVLSGNPWLDEVLLLEKNAWSRIKLLARIRQERFDLVLDLFSNPATALFTLLSGAPIRVGFAFRHRRFGYTIALLPRGGEVHNVEFNLDALRALGLVPERIEPRVFLSADERAFARAFIEKHNLAGMKKIFSSQNTPLIGFSIGGGWQTKRWLSAYYVKLGKRIVEEFGASIMLLYGPDEEQEARGIADGIGAGAILPPIITLRQLAALAEVCHLVVSNDTGPMHIAAAVGTPVLAIFGPTRPELQGPVGNYHRIVRNESVNCLGCNLTKCPIGNICMTELYPDKVFEEFLQLHRQIEERNRDRVNVEKYL